MHQQHVAQLQKIIMRGKNKNNTQIAFKFYFLLPCDICRVVYFSMPRETRDYLLIFFLKKEHLNYIAKIVKRQ